jgi:hypothetical protein
LKRGVSKMSDGAQGLIKEYAPIPPIEGVIDAFYKDGGHFRFVGRTDEGVDISVDMEHGEMLADVGGLIIRVSGGRASVNEGRFAVYNARNGACAELDIEAGSRFRLKFAVSAKKGK